MRLDGTATGFITGVLDLYGLMFGVLGLGVLLELPQHIFMLYSCLRHLFLVFGF
jgi:hypothetical protein